MSKDMRGQDLTQFNFYESDLRNANLEGANLAKIRISEISFEGANLTDASINDGNITDTDFTNAILTSANVSRTGFTFCSFINTTLKSAILTRISVHDGTFEDVDMQDAMLDYAIITTRFNRVILDSASLQNTTLTLQANSLSLQLAQLNKASIYNSSFTEVNGQGAEIENANISNSTFEHCNFTNGNLQQIIVGETIFTDCSFRDGSLQKSVISKSHFIRCDFTNCDLQFVNLADCTLKDCILTGAKYNSGTYWPAGFDIESQGAIREMTDMEKNIAAIQAHMDSPHLSEDTSQMLLKEYEQTGTITSPDRTHKETGTWTTKDDIFGSNESTNKPNYDQTKAIEEFLQDGLKIQAIKLWRKCTGNSLKESKDIIDYFEQNGVWMTVDDLPTQVAVVSNFSPIQNLGAEQTQPSSSIDSLQTVSPENLCASLIEEGKKVQAIKLWREKTGASLKEAKMQIEQFEREGIWSPIVDTSESKVSKNPEPYDAVEDNVDPVARQGFGFGYWLVVLILLVFLATRLLS